MKLINRLATKFFVMVLVLEAFLLVTNHTQKAVSLANILFLTIIVIVISAWFTYDKK